LLSSSFDSFFWSSSENDDDENENDDVLGAANPILEKQLFLLLLQKRLLCAQSKRLEKEEDDDVEDAPTARISSSFLRERERERVGRTVPTRKLAKRNKKETEKRVFRVLKIRDIFAPPNYFSHKNHRPKGWWWFCRGVRLSPRERRDKEKNTKKKSFKGFGRVQKKRKYSTTTAKNTIRKSEKSAQHHQQYLKIRSKSHVPFLLQKVFIYRSKNSYCEFRV
tara:strand:- start:732 stop:1397 length:666 start_codon:yes stop_codon:yes gene_type:complete